MDAIRLAIAKALCTINIEYRQIFNQNLLLRRDSRIKERRKYGLKKARKASQFSKR
jgi:small subunit ribosomal protein S9